MVLHTAWDGWGVISRISGERYLYIPILGGSIITECVYRQEVGGGGVILGPTGWFRGRSNVFVSEIPIAFFTFIILLNFKHFLTSEYDHSSKVMRRRKKVSTHRKSPSFRSPYFSTSLLEWALYPPFFGGLVITILNTFPDLQITNKLNT